MADSSDRPGFDVYGMLLLLGFFMTLGATLLLNDELSSNWGFRIGGDPPPAQTWHLTQYRDLNKTYIPSAPYIDIRKKDLDEWKAARNRTGAVNGASFPVKDFEWPAGYKPNEFPVDPLKENNWESAQPNASDDAKTAKSKADLLEQFNLLLNSSPKDVPDAPKEDAPKVDAPKTDAPKTDAPKTDAPAPDKKDDATPKADATKTDATKTDAK